MTDVIYGRDATLTRLEAILQPDATKRIAFVHGPGGIGKSTVVLELLRRARALGLEASYVDARIGPEAVAALDAALARGGLIVLDTYEQGTALGGQIREELPATGRALIAGRQPPERNWDDVPIVVVALQPLDADAGVALVRAEGVQAPDAVGAIVRWGKGSPLALELAARAVRDGQRTSFDALETDVLLATALLDGVLGGELGDYERGAIEVASLARAVDARLLAAVLPGVDGDHAEAWLRGLGCAEPFGTRVTLHERVRGAVVDHLQRHAGDHERDLRRRLADHLYARTSLGEPHLAIDLAELITDEGTRWGLAPSRAIRYRLAQPRPEDPETIARLDSVQTSGWRAGLRRWFDDAPHTIVTVRDADNQLIAYGVFCTTAGAPDWAADDPLVGPSLAHIRAHGRADEAGILRDSGFFDVPDGEASEATAMANLALMLGSGLRPFRYTYVFVDRARTGYAGVVGFLESVGYERAALLTVSDADRVVDCFLVDWGPAGTISFLRDAVYAELGLTTTPPAEVVESAAAVVRNALRSYHDPSALAASPLARRGTESERAAEVRALLESAAESAFGHSTDERVQRTTIRRGYLDADGGHTRAAAELNLSRTAYFRRLADATRRVTEYVTAIVS